MVPMKNIQVVGAAIMKNGKLFAAQRPDRGETALKWEFPGGKIEEGESPEQALIREVREELAADIIVEKYITKVEYQYKTFHLNMQLFRCSLTGGDPVISEHVACRWLDRDELESLDWAPADLGILDEVREACFSNC